VIAAQAGGLSVFAVIARADDPARVDGTAFAAVYATATAPATITAASVPAVRRLAAVTTPP
jgi:hypothetical protein